MRGTMRRLAPALSLTLALALTPTILVTAAAQDATSDPRPADLTGMAQKMVGKEMLYGVYLDGSAIGSLHLRAMAAPDNGIRIESTFELTLGPVTSRLEEALEADADLTWRLFERTETSAEATTSVRVIRRADGKCVWQREATALTDGTPGDPLRRAHEIHIPPGTLPWITVLLVGPLLDWSSPAAPRGLRLFDVEAGEVVMGRIEHLREQALETPTGTVTATVLRATNPTSNETLLISVADRQALQVSLETEAGGGFHMRLEPRQETTTPPASATIPGGEADARRLVQGLCETGNDRLAAVRALRPDREDYRSVFVAGQADLAEAGYREFWEKRLTAFPPVLEAKDIRLWRTTSDRLQSPDASPAATSPFSSRWRDVAPHLQQGLEIWAFEVTASGEEDRVSTQGLIYINGHWVLIPKPWKVLQ